MRALMWSRKFSPTAGSSCFTSMPCCFSSSGWPMPESSRICGEATPPADRIVSLRARLHHLAVLLVLDADAALALEQHAQGHGVGDDMQVVRPLHRRLDVAMRHAHAPAPIDRGLRLHDAFLVLAVVVGVELVAGRHGRLEQRVIERVLVGHGRDLERAVGAAAVAAVAVDEVLDAGEQRRHLAPAPAAAAHLRPGVVVERLAAHPDQAVDRARAAQQLSARHRDGPVGRAGLGLGLVEPVGRRIVDQQAEAERHAGIGMACRTGFEQQHPGRRFSVSRAASVPPAEPAPTMM